MDHALLKLINYQLDIDKIYLQAKVSYEVKQQFLIRKCEKVDLDYFNGSKDFIEYSNDMQDVYKNIEEYNSGKKVKYYQSLMTLFLVLLVTKP